MDCMQKTLIELLGCGNSVRGTVRRRACLWIGNYPNGTRPGGPWAGLPTGPRPPNLVRRTVQCQW